MAVRAVDRNQIAASDLQHSMTQMRSHKYTQATNTHNEQTHQSGGRGDVLRVELCVCLLRQRLITGCGRQTHSMWLLLLLLSKTERRTVHLRKTRETRTTSRVKRQIRIERGRGSQLDHNTGVGRRGFAFVCVAAAAVCAYVLDAICIQR